MPLRNETTFRIPHPDKTHPPHPLPGARARSITMSHVTTSIPEPRNPLSRIEHPRSQTQMFFFLSFCLSRSLTHSHDPLTIPDPLPSNTRRPRPPLTPLPASPRPTHIPYLCTLMLDNRPPAHRAPHHEQRKHQHDGQYRRSVLVPPPPQHLVRPLVRGVVVICIPFPPGDGVEDGEGRDGCRGGGRVGDV